MMNEARLREEIVAQGKAIYDRGLTHGNTGNISVKLDDGWLFSPTGSCLGRLDPAAISKVDYSGRHVSGHKPTKEDLLHRAVYGERPECGAVVHLHSTYSVAVSVLRGLNPDNLLPALTAYYVMKIGILPLIPYYPPGDRTLADAVRTCAASHHAMLLAHHGPVVAGKNLSAAVDAIEELEETARLFLLVQRHRYNVLDNEQIAFLWQKHPVG
jgi:ribulose-5-phosphate 4-epimerase/fuculose-1-phosphate aldolase